MVISLSTDQMPEENNNYSSQSQEPFEQAKRFWDLERLYIDLIDAKGKKLTPTEKEYLCGLLLNYSPKEIAHKLCKEVNGVRVALTNLYRYVQILCTPPDGKVNCRNITVILENAGYKLSSSRQFKQKVFLSCSPQKQTLKLAGQLYEALLAVGYKVSMTGQTLRLLTEWPDCLERELEECDCFVLILSEQFPNNEIILEELRQARTLRDSRPEAKPAILVVRVGFSQSVVLHESLRFDLDGVPQLGWHMPTSKNPHLILEILGILAMGSVEIEQLLGGERKRLTDTTTTRQPRIEQSPLNCKQTIVPYYLMDASRSPLRISELRQLSCEGISVHG